MICFLLSKVRSYYSIIKEPMDFGTMRAKLHEGMYNNLEEFEVHSHINTFPPCSLILSSSCYCIQEKEKIIISFVFKLHQVLFVSGETMCRQIC